MITVSLSVWVYIYEALIHRAIYKGVTELFESLIRDIIAKRETIEHERELRERDSVYLSHCNTQSSTQDAIIGDEGVSQPKRSGWSNCC